MESKFTNWPKKSESKLFGNMLPVVAGLGFDEDSGVVAVAGSVSEIWCPATWGFPPILAALLGSDSESDSEAEMGSWLVSSSSGDRASSCGLGPTMGCMLVCDWD